jgi:hypothetical protein
VVHVIDAALSEAQVTQVDLVKDHSLQDIVRIVRTFNTASLTTKYGGWVSLRAVYRLYINYQYFPFSTASKPTLEPTQPPVQWVPVALSPGVKRQGP